MIHACIDCGRSESEVRFQQRPSGNLRPYCEGCRSIRNAARLYGLSADAYHALLIKQDGCCAICGIHSENAQHKSFKRLVVDHDHTSGKVRGLLCSKCNTGLGQFNDSAKLLSSAITYLST